MKISINARVTQKPQIAILIRIMEEIKTFVSQEEAPEETPTPEEETPKEEEEPSAE